MLVIIITQFWVENWINKPMSLSLGTKAAVKLAQHLCQSEDVCPLVMRFFLCFDEYGCNYVSGGHKKDSRRPLGKRPLSRSEVDIEEKSIPQFGQKP